MILFGYYLNHFIMQCCLFLYFLYYFLLFVTKRQRSIFVCMLLMCWMSWVSLVSFVNRYASCSFSMFEIHISHMLRQSHQIKLVVIKGESLLNWSFFYVCSHNVNRIMYFTTIIIKTYIHRIYRSLSCSVAFIWHKQSLLSIFERE